MVLVLFRHLVAYDSVDGADGWNSLLVADALCQQPIPYLPGKHRRVFHFIFRDGVDHFWRGDFGFGPADDAGPNGTGLVKSSENFGNAAVRNAELARDVARTNPLLREIDDSLANNVWERTTVDKDAAQLIDAPVTLGVAVV